LENVIEIRPKLKPFFSYIINTMIEKSILNQTTVSEWKTMQIPMYNTFREGDVYIDTDLHMSLVNDVI